ncbi:hypothetical protein OIDMADRAFT_16559 [Oidiodendron maius Zn]|uniref:Uncharacterized protein n=1 Tax=Oidiodendron maius (strain Zn) TaxID=913774 RepID=A0A0C3DA84_OIDMZ|nr:hypothetical protein OIDMADRAFT_16559 [Oidiodendron maius Zn]
MQANSVSSVNTVRGTFWATSQQSSIPRLPVRIESALPIVYFSRKLAKGRRVPDSDCLEGLHLHRLGLLRRDEKGRHPPREGCPS